jgi:AcrR family transcriptional regulator
VVVLLGDLRQREREASHVVEQRDHQIPPHLDTQQTSLYPRPMAIAPQTVPSRMSGSDRRELVMDAAVAEFGEHGWHGARIEAIAARAGISHPYLLRLFSSKRELFIAATHRAFDRMEETFSDAVARGGDDPILALGEAYRLLLRDDPATLRLHMHALAVAGDPQVGEAVTRRYAALLQRMRELSGATEDRVRTCFAVGLTLTVVTVLDLPDRAGDIRWAARLLASGAPA